MLALGLVGSLCSAAAEIGKPAPQFSLQDQNGKTVSLSDYSGKIVVLEWTNPNCPIVGRHYKAKTMVTLAGEFVPKGVVWLAVNSTHTDGDAENLAWVNKNSLSYPVLNDASGTVGKAYGAKTTPNMFIVGKDGTLLYSGGIDNDPDGDKGAATVNYVRQALTEILGGSAVSVPETKSYGCSVKYAD
jgi:peroxiredoxin